MLENMSMACSVSRKTPVSRPNVLYVEITLNMTRLWITNNNIYMYFIIMFLFLTEYYNHIISTECRIYASVIWVNIILGDGLSPIWCQAITWTNAALFSNGAMETNVSEIRIKIQKFSFMKMLLKMSSAKMAAILSRVGGWVYNCNSIGRGNRCEFK